MTSKTYPRVAVYYINEYAVNTLIVFRAMPQKMRPAIALSTRPGEPSANPTLILPLKRGGVRGLKPRPFRGHMRGVTMGLN